MIEEDEKILQCRAELDSGRLCGQSYSTTLVREHIKRDSSIWPYLCPRCWEEIFASKLTLTCAKTGQRYPHTAIIDCKAYLVEPSICDGCGVGKTSEQKKISDFPDDDSFYTKKHDKGKPRMSLLPFDALEEVAKVLTFGAEKYAANSWQTVPDAKARYMDALLRHYVAIQKGEANDPESGLSHWSHLACNALFLLSLDIRGKDLEDAFATMVEAMSTTTKKGVKQQ